jgi:hypothetical protein
MTKCRAGQAADYRFWGLLWLFFPADLEGRLGAAAGSAAVGGGGRRGRRGRGVGEASGGREAEARVAGRRRGGTKDNLVKINWHGNEKCCFLIIMNLYNISVLIVFSLSSFGE